MIGYVKKPPLTWRNVQTVGIVPPTGGVSYLTFGDKTFEVTAPLEASLGVSGLGGMLTGPVKANTVYYAYAILSGQTPQLAISLKPPTTGPGLSPWTYVGAVRTLYDSSLAHFQKSGVVSLVESGTDEGIFSNVAWSAITVNVPVTATAVYLRMVWTAVAAAGNLLSLGAISGSGHASSRATSSAVWDANPVGLVWVPIITPKTIWGSTSNDSDEVTVRSFGWQEDPEIYA